MTGADVNVPTNTKIKEQDVNAKLQLYGIYSAFANGKVPSNKQIDVALSTITKKKFLATPSKRLSPEGQKLVGDFRDVVEKAKLLLLSKNEGNVIQDFIWQTQQITGNNANTPNAPLDKSTAQQHGDQALEGLRTLGSLLISNGQFRKLLNDVVILARDIAGDAAQKAATKVNPSDEQLSQLDRPADDNTWHENPDLSKDSLKQQWNERKPFSKEDVQNTANKAYNRAEQPDGSVDPTQAAQTAKVDLHQTANQQSNPEDREKAEDAKNTAREYRDRTNNYLKNKVPEERRDQTIWRLKKMVAEIQGHQDYQQAINTLLRLAEEYAGHGKNLANQSVGTVQEARGDSALQKAEYDLKTIIERFANSTSLDDLFDSINQIYQDADRDPELKDWFKKLDSFIRRSLQEQGYILQDASTDEWNKLYDHGNFLLRERYRNHTDRILDEFKFYFDQFDQDSQNQAFGQAVQKLFLDLGNDENGKATFKPHLIKDLTDVILPAFFENIRYVPIPRIEFRDPTVDLVIENLVIEGDNLAPNVFEFGSDNYWRWGRKQNASKNKNKVMLAVSGVQCDLRDVSFYVKKKDGFPAITDKGLMDVKIAGSGISFKVAMETADDKDKSHFFKVNKVDVSLKNVSINLKQSNHKLLFKLFKPLLLKVMNPVLQKVIEKQVRDQIQQADATLFAIHKEAEKAKARVKENPEEAENFYQRYTQAINDRITQAKQKKEEIQSKNEVNVAVTQHDSIFPDIKLPGGISTKATEYRDLAAKGDKWESPIFSIGSASESINIPKLASVSRKPHNVTQGGLRGGVGNTPGYAGQPGQNFTNQVNQAGPHSTSQSGYSSGQPGYSTGQPGYSTGQPGYSTGQPGYSTGQPGYSSGLGSSAQSGLTSGQSAHPPVGTSSGGLTGQSLGANQPGVVNQTVGTAQPGLTQSSVPGTSFGNQVDNAFNTKPSV